MKFKTQRYELRNKFKIGKIIYNSKNIFIKEKEKFKIIDISKIVAKKLEKIITNIKIEIFFSKIKFINYILFSK